MNSRKELIEKIIGELNGRKGFDDWWYNIDEDIQEEITETLVNILPIHNVSGCSCDDCEKVLTANGGDELHLCMQCANNR